MLDEKQNLEAMDEKKSKAKQTTHRLQGNTTKFCGPTLMLGQHNLQHMTDRQLFIFLPFCSLGYNLQYNPTNLSLCSTKRGTKKNIYSAGPTFFNNVPLKLTSLPLGGSHHNGHMEHMIEGER